MNTKASVFEYMYRDAGNWKTGGVLLLEGEIPCAGKLIRECCESGIFFVAEQVGIPALCEKHWSDYGDGPSNDDHAFHEFVDVRCASSDEITTLPFFGSLSELMKRMSEAKGRWDVMFSPNSML